MDCKKNIFPYSTYSKINIGKECVKNIFPNPIGRFDPRSLNPSFAYTGVTNGSGDLIDVSGNGYNATYVSGTGLDAIYDFAALNTALGNNQLNKNAYLGNAFGLPEHYDWPYVDIYYDVANPTYWKLTDFHYKNYNTQALDESTLDDTVFLKAKATTTTSNEITSLSELYIFSTQQTGDALQSLKDYIGIQASFEGEEIAEGWNTAAFWSYLIDPNWTINEGVNLVSDGNTGFLIKYGGWTLNQQYIIRTSVIVNSGTYRAPFDGTGGVLDITESGDYEYLYAPDTTTNIDIYSYLFNGTITALSIKPYYENYYKD